ncbi:MAG: SDR family oxidoreductase [Paracoccaceae bacterium]|jgi:NAD(P)-dependent dehydrogenase (short-subunit alcohol dehydrogenase family)|nr:SDR family oxidoreductase [Paracoccaceae bacterium]
MRFKDKVVIVTGACGGIGSKAVEGFLEEGALVLASDLEKEQLEELKTNFNTSRLITLAGDVRKSSTHLSLVETAVTTFGGLDIALNNAGISHEVVKLPLIEEEVARRVFDIDLMAVFLAMRAQLPIMAEQFSKTGRCGAIVNVSSAAGLVAAPLMSVYSAAKHGVIGLTKSAAAEYAKRGVRINSICPAFTKTAMVEGFFENTQQDREKAIERLTQGMPMSRMAEVSEIIVGILFAADPSNSFMTGNSIAIDGGLTAV